MEPTTTAATKTMTARHIVKMSEVMREQVSTLAAQEGCSRSEIIRRAITTYAAQQER